MTARPAPTWADPPLDMEGAARALGICRRKLTAFLNQDLKGRTLYETRGRKKVFYREHIAGIREALNCQKTGNRPGRKKKAGTSISRSEVGAFAEDLAFVIGQARRKPSPVAPQNGSGQQPGKIISLHQSR